MKDKILITGANSQLGTELKKILSNAVYTDVTDLDITDSRAVDTYIKANNITTIINCAAYTAVDNAEDNASAAYKVNVIGVENLAKTGCKIIHISTDYVFDGQGHKPYAPEDNPAPLSVYGQSKLEGEKAVLDNASTAVIIRTAWMYSIYGNNFVKTMRRLGKEKDSINVITDQIGSPTYAADLAEAIVAILPQMNKRNKGIYHYTNEGVCSWYDFACAIMELSRFACHVHPIPSSAYPTKAARPFYSVLDKSKIKKTFNIKIPHWRESLKQCLKQF